MRDLQVDKLIKLLPLKETKLRHRLDYIFVSHDIKVLDFSVGKSKGSDHLPVIATVKI